MKPHTMMVLASSRGICPISSRPPQNDSVSGVPGSILSSTQRPSGASFKPGALETMCASPCGSMTTSPSRTCSGGSPSTAIQPPPFTNRW